MNNKVSEYAESLFVLGQEKGLTEDYCASLLLVKEVLDENPEYLHLLHSPALSVEERLGLIDSAFGNLKAEDVLSFLKLLCEKGRIQTLPACIKDYFDMVKDAENKVLVRVFSANELSGEQKERLCEKLSKKTGKKKYKSFSVKEKFIAKLFAALYGLLFLLSIVLAILL